MGRDTRTCAVCRTAYTYCPRCNDDKDKPTWMFTWCSDNCRNIYKTLTSFEEGSLTAVQANELLNGYDLSRKSNYGDSYLRIMSEIENALPKKEPEVIETSNEMDDSAIADQTSVAGMPTKISYKSKRTK